MSLCVTWQIILSHYDNDDALQDDFAYHDDDALQDDFAYYFAWKKMIEEEVKKKDGNDQDTVSCLDDYGIDDDFDDDDLMMMTMTYRRVGFAGV